MQVMCIDQETEGCALTQFFLNVFTEFTELSDKIFVITAKGLEPNHFQQ